MITRDEISFATFKSLNGSAKIGTKSSAGQGKTKASFSKAASNEKLSLNAKTLRFKQKALKRVRESERSVNVG